MIMLTEVAVQGKRLAGFLETYGANLIRVAKREDGGFNYMFEDNDTLREAVAAFEEMLAYGFY